MATVAFLPVVIHRICAGTLAGRGVCIFQQFGEILFWIRIPGIALLEPAYYVVGGRNGVWHQRYFNCLCRHIRQYSQSIINVYSIAGISPHKKKKQQTKF